MNAMIQEPRALGLGRSRPNVIRTKEDHGWSDSCGRHCRQDGK
jgi:hypothetical protein